MPFLYRSNLSDQLSSDALNRWSLVEAWLSSKGFSIGVLPLGRGPWDQDNWLVADPSGGSQALDQLPELMETLPGPAHHPGRRAWWSMSDNSMVLNALLDRGLCRLLHGHPLTLAGRDAPSQRERFERWFPAVESNQPFPNEVLPKIRPLRGSLGRRGTLVGGNLGALERLGTTPWRPSPQGRILLVESLSCPANQAPHRVSALVSDPWWESIGGLALGRFSVADRDDPTWVDRCLGLLPPDLPVVRIPQVGHGADGWTVPLGEEISLTD